MPRLVAWVCSLVLVVSCAGCGKNDIKPIANLVPVSGTITFDGKPLAQGTISLAPAEGTGQTATGKISNGSFTVNTTVSAPGVVAGKYKVKVEALEGDGIAKMPAQGEEPQPPKSLIPEKYNDINTSGLEAEVKAGMSALKFELKTE